MKVLRKNLFQFNVSYVMTALTQCRENIKVLRRLINQEKYLLRQYKAHKKNNMSKK